MQIDELRDELRRLAAEVEPFTTDGVDLQRRNRRRRTVQLSIAAALVVVVGLTAVLVASRGGPAHVTVTNPKEVGTVGQLRRVDVVVVPGTPAVAARLESSPLVTAYAPLAPGQRSLGSSFPSPLTPALCALQPGGGYAVQVASQTTTHAQLVSALGADVFDVMLQKGDVEVFMQVDASRANTAAVAAQLRRDPQVESTRFIDHNAAYAEFTHDFADQPTLIQGTTPDALPESYRIIATPDANVTAMARRYEQLPGVDTAITRATATFGELLNPTPTVPGNPQTLECKA